MKDVWGGLSEDSVCQLIAEKLATSADFKNWFLWRTPFGGRRFTTQVLKTEQIAARPKVLPSRWWRHWFWRIPELAREYETDIFLVFKEEQSQLRFAMHVEVKTASKLAQGQAESYRPRARYVMTSDRRMPHTDCGTVFIAPKQMIDTSPDVASLFDTVIQLEEIAAFLPELSTYPAAKQMQSATPPVAA